MRRTDLRSALLASLNCRSLHFYLLLTESKSLAKFTFYKKLHDYIKIFYIIRLVLLFVMCGVFLVDAHLIIKILHALATIIIYEVINRYEIFGKELYKRLEIFWRGIYSESMNLRESEKICYTETLENYCDLLVKIDAVTQFEPIHSPLERLELLSYEMRAFRDILLQEIAKVRTV